METRNFRHLLESQWRRDRMVCVGLDPDWEKIPPSLKTHRGHELDPTAVILYFNRKIIEATCEVAGAYKPQAAYYEKWGAAGWEVLKRTVEHMDRHAPDTPRILDAKRGDMDRTNRGYAEGIFDHLGFDAVTLHPYLGGVQSLRPFLDRNEKGLFVMCRNSNPDAGEFQDLPVALDESELGRLLAGPARTGADEEALGSASIGRHRLVPLYKIVALRVANHWNEHGNCGLVVGATYPAEAREIRRLVGDDLPFLVPGVGAQGGDVAAAVQACRNSRGEGFVISSSSGIIHASQGPDFAERAREKAIELHEAILQSRDA